MNVLSDGALSRETPEPYLEDALERELSRFIPGLLNRFIATELVLIVSAVQYLCGGFRRPLPAGFSYVRRWASMPLFVAMPVLIVPEMIAFDFVLWNAGWWRVLSDVLHVYAMLWAIGIVATARIRPHRCDAEGVRLRFGCLRRLDLERANVANARVHGTMADDFTRTLRRAGDAAAEEAETISDCQGSAAYKRQLVRVYVRRALSAALTGTPH